MTGIHYRFLPSGHEPIDIGIRQAEDGRITGVDPGAVAFDEEVTRLSFQQCRNCPLEETDTGICPLAAVVCPAVARFQNWDSYTPVRMLVKTDARNYHKDTTIQGGLSSLLGLLMGGSGCPYMAFFRPMARFHLPFATEEETVFRAISNMAVAGYFSRSGSQNVDEIELVTGVYRNIQILNQGVSGRLKAMTESDATNNAVVLLDLFAKALGSYLDEGMERVGALYEPFIRQNLTARPV